MSLKKEMIKERENGNCYDVYFENKNNNFAAVHNDEIFYMNESGGSTINQDDYVIVEREYFNKISNNQIHKTIEEEFND